MEQRSVACLGCTPAAGFAADYLEEEGWTVTASVRKDTRHILLDVPSFGTGRLEHPEELLSSLPAGCTVYGGKLDHPGLREFRLADFLQDPYYLAENAAITAQCALETAMPHLTVTFDRLPVLLIGWGRIGKCLARLLGSLGAKVTVAVRKPDDRAMAKALGYDVLTLQEMCSGLKGFRLVYNTVPERILDVPREAFHSNCVKIDLASRIGITGEDVIRARGLPGLLAPEASGRLIAETFLRLVKEDRK